jgi:hypothetical protein
VLLAVAFEQFQDASRHAAGVREVERDVVVGYAGRIYSRAG